MVSSVSSGNSGGDACAAWDSRLRAARLLVRAAHHAQRRLVHYKYQQHAVMFENIDLV